MRDGYPADVIAESEEHRLRLRRIVDAVRPQRLWHGHYHCRYHAVLAPPEYTSVIDGLGKNGDPMDNAMVVVDLADLGMHWRCARRGCGGRVPGTATTSVAALDLDRS